MEEKKEEQECENRNPIEENVIKSQSDTKVTDYDITVEKNLKLDVAGPSRIINLPGAITPTTVLKKTGKSKSEANIRQIITSNDCGRTVALTSLSFQNPEKCIENKEECIALTNFIDLKKFMASCFKNDVNSPFIIKEAINLPIVTTDNGQNISNSVTPPTPQSFILNIDSNEINTTVSSTASNGNTKVPKVISDVSKRNTSGHISEQSDLIVTQRDSLSSIGSNVCRICMTRGRERYVAVSQNICILLFYIVFVYICVLKGKSFQCYLT